LLGQPVNKKANAAAPPINTTVFLNG